MPAIAAMEVVAKRAQPIGDAAVTRRINGGVQLSITIIRLLIFGFISKIVDLEARRALFLLCRATSVACSHIATPHSVMHLATAAIICNRVVAKTRSDWYAAVSASCGPARKLLVFCHRSFKLSEGLRLLELACIELRSAVVRLLSVAVMLFGPTLIRLFLTTATPNIFMITVATVEDRIFSFRLRFGARPIWQTSRFLSRLDHRLSQPNLNPLGLAAIQFGMTVVRLRNLAFISKIGISTAPT
jgi:hypothetical protein